MPNVSFNDYIFEDYKSEDQKNLCISIQSKLINVILLQRTAQTKQLKALQREGMIIPEEYDHVD